MGEARDVMDRLTEAVFIRKDLRSVAECYANDAVAVTPDQGEITGRDQIIRYLAEFLEAFPDAHDEVVHKHESGNVAVDEGYVIGTNTAPLPMPSGQSIPATGKHIRLRECDVVTVDDGLVKEHRFYFDQMEFLGQLGLSEQAS